ncbi:MAG: hypothetical protein KDC84_03995 [Crocinitomicaceae bacterium]|nr:hypothetical protein [Crocinitomicaceae bacterium]
MSHADFLLFGALMLLNWYLESLKWKFLVRGIEDISQTQAIKATLAGMSFGLLTPNRMGNFIGKIIYLQPGNRLEGTLFALYGNFSQMLTTFLFGSFCFLFTFENYYSQTNVFMAVLPFAFSLGLAFLFLFPQKLNLNFAERVLSQELFGAFNRLIHFKGKEVVLGYSILRHLVFTIQYLIVLFYSPVFEFWSSFMAIQMIFFLTTIIPGLVFGKMMVRGPVAIFVLGILGYSTSFAINAILFIWLINIALPSLVGSFLFMIKKRG